MFIYDNCKLNYFNILAADSMTAFLMAEQLAQQSMSESQMHHAINDVQSNPISANRPAPNGKYNLTSVSSIKIKRCGKNANETTVL